MINDFTKKEAPILSTLGLGGGNASRLFLSGAVLSNRSLRFNDDDQASLSRTPSSAGNRKTFTYSCWFKRANISRGYLFSVWNSDTDSEVFAVQLSSSHTLNIDLISKTLRITDQVFRDPSAWYHLVIAVDTTQSTASNRLKVYINGSQVTSFSTNVNFSQNDDTGVNGTFAHQIGRYFRNSSTEHPFDGYMADIYLIDGSALDPTSFGAADSNGVWQRSTYSGSYGTNGFHILDFANDGTIGSDTSGNGNTFTANNFSTTAGSGNDVLFDFPTNDTVNTDAGAGGEVTGNYACINPLLKPDTQTVTLSNGNLDFSSGAASGQYGTRVTSIGVSSGKWYAEFTVGATANGIFFGITNAPNGESNYIGGHSTSYGYVNNGQKYNNNSGSSYGASFTTNDVIGLALDLDNGTLTFYKNGSTQGTAYSSLPSGTYFMGISGTGNATAVCNFGQREFSNAAPSNHKCLTTTSLPTPGVADGSDYFNTKLWTGTQASLAITGLGFNPDLVWGKRYSTTGDNILIDSVRGVNKYLRANLTNSEPTNADLITSFDSDGFTVGDSTGLNLSGASIVGWAWDAGSSTVSNTDGSITSQVRANQTAGFSVVSFTASGTAGSDSCGHGLNAVPGLVMIKARDATDDWYVWHQDFSNLQRNYISLNSTAAVTLSSNDSWGAGMTSSVIGFRSQGTAQGNMIAYCFAPVAGFSAMSVYSGNSSTDGVFVHTGFRPAWLMVKSTNATGSWSIFDNKRDPFNVMDRFLFAEQNFAEQDSDTVDFLSNGFKFRTGGGDHNYSGRDYLYLAFAENPFQANGGLAR